MYIILAFIIVFCALGIFILQKVLKNTLAESDMNPQGAYNGKYYVCFLIAQLDFENPQFFQLVDFSKYDESGIVYLRLDASDMKDVPRLFEMTVEQAATPAAIGWVELFEIEEGVWKWRQLSS